MRLFVVGFATLGLMMPAFGQVPLPQGKAFALSYEKAISCATQMANQSSFDREDLNSIPKEILEHCAKERDSAIQELNAANPNPDSSVPRNWVAAEMRRTVQERLIKRLEAGERPKADDNTGHGLEAVAFGYAFCVRFAINHKLEGMYFGEDLKSEIGGVPEDQIEGYFVSIGRTSCPISFQRFTDAFKTALNASEAGLRKTISDKLSPKEIEGIAVESYIELSAVFRKKKP